MENFKMFDIIGDITPNTDLAFSKFLNEVFKEDETIPIIITINSYGGHTQSGISIYNKIRAIKNPVYTLITGVCKSIATIILLAVPYERRFSFPDTSFFIHSVFVREITNATVSDLKKYISSGEKDNLLIYNIISKETTIDATTLNRIFFDYSLERFELAADHYIYYSIAHVVTTFTEVIGN